MSKDKKHFTMYMDNNFNDKFLHLVKLLDPEGRQSVVVRGLVEATYTFVQARLKSHPIEPGETLGLDYLGEAYDPQIIEDKEQAFTNQLWDRYPAEMLELATKQEEIERQLAEIETRELKVESELTRCERCEYKDYYDKGIAEQTRRAEEYEMYKFSHRWNFSLQWPWDARKTAIFVLALVIMMLMCLGADLGFKWLQFHKMLSGFGL